MSTDQELRCVISDLMDQVRDRDAEIARLTEVAERAWKESDESRRLTWETVAAKNEACDRLTAERDAAIARAERAERVAVDAACHHGWRGAKPSGSEFIETPCPACGGRLFISSGGHLTCAVIGCRNPSLRGLTCPKDGGALIEACEGGKSNG